MTTIINHLEDMRDWLEREICANLSFKSPPENEEVDAEEYTCEFVHPGAYIMYPPPDKKIPSVTIQFSQGEENKISESGEMEVKLLFGVWNPGLHYIDSVKIPMFEVNHDGWRDVWNFIDYTLRKLMNSDYIGSSRIIHSSGIKYGPMTEQDTAVNYYPHWCGWLTFSIQYGTVSTNTDILDEL